MQRTKRFLERRRYSLTLACLPVVVFFSAAIVTKPPQPAPMPVQVVASEGIRSQRVDALSFDRRFEPVVRLPPTALIAARVPPDNVEAAPATAATQAAPIPRQRILTKRTSLRASVCERHGLRKVITRAGKSWRCRR